MQRFFTDGLATILGVLLTFTVLMSWSYIEYDEEFLNFSQFRIYSPFAFVATFALVLMFIRKKTSFYSSIGLLLLSGFLIYTLIGTFRFFVIDGYDSWKNAISGSSTLPASIIVNGGFISIFAIFTYFFAKLILSIISRKIQDY